MYGMCRDRLSIQMETNTRETVSAGGYQVVKASGAVGYTNKAIFPVINMLCHAKKKICHAAKQAGEQCRQ